MVKIERLNSAKAVFVRDNIEQPVIINMTMTIDEFRTIEVLEGSVVVSIDEIDLVTLTAKPRKLAETVVVPDNVVVPVKPVIVKPVSRKK